MKSVISLLLKKFWSHSINTIHKWKFFLIIVRIKLQNQTGCGWSWSDSNRQDYWQNEENSGKKYLGSFFREFVEGDFTEDILNNNYKTMIFKDFPLSAVHYNFSNLSSLTFTYHKKSKLIVAPFENPSLSVCLDKFSVSSWFNNKSVAKLSVKKLLSNNKCEN